ncbi:MAG: hypothetical protein EBQ62_04565 [Alphaproteobacteria bacterium]|nr:hypothetical protein [Alphaproteobacteria bacterium]
MSCFFVTSKFSYLLGETFVPSAKVKQRLDFTLFSSSYIGELLFILFNYIVLSSRVNYPIIVWDIKKLDLIKVVSIIWLVLS